ncbi:hypothetical protein [Trichothermofontia sp.]
MTKLLEAMAYHGWGFGSPCWQAWQTRFLSWGQCQWHGYDRGYWGERQAPQFLATDSHKVVLTHSYGLHWWMSDWQGSGLLTNIDLLVIFGGFQRFHPSEPKAKRRSQRVLRQMISQLEQAPLTVLRQFYQNCDYPEAIEYIRMETLDYALLRSDLHALDQAQLDVTLLKQIPRIVIFQGLQDQIVPVAQAEQLWAQMRFSRGDTTQMQSSGNCQYIPFAGGHALPFTHLEACWAILQSVLADTILQRRRYANGD